MVFGCFPGAVTADAGAVEGIGVTVSGGVETSASVEAVTTVNDVASTAFSRAVRGNSASTTRYIACVLALTPGNQDAGSARAVAGRDEVRISSREATCGDTCTAGAAPTGIGSDASGYSVSDVAAGGSGLSARSIYCKKRTI